jgi:hypothetical protein
MKAGYGISTMKTAIGWHDRTATSLLCGVFLIAATSVIDVGPAHALSEIPREDLQPAPDTSDQIEREPLPDIFEEDTPRDGVQEVPFPDPIVPPRDPELPSQRLDGDDEASAPPQIQYDLSGLPEPVRRMRDLIREATLTGDPEALRPLLGLGEGATQLSLGSTPDDPIAFLRDLSGDGEGQEILAILYEVLDTGYVHLDVGTPEELYVWPYFFAVPLETLDPRQRVELFKLVTAGDYDDMKAFGAYIFYRVGITPDGRWQFFVAGD